MILWLRKKINPISILFIIFLLLYSRFSNLTWGLPYSMHPDERNMAIALMNLKTENGFNPDFFAYGHFPLYLGYILLQIYYFINSIQKQFNYYDATIVLRFISAFASVINVFILYKIIVLLSSHIKIKLSKLFIIPLLLFIPYAIQFSHFGTTESLLMLFYSLIIYLSILMIQNRILNSKFLILNSLLCGLALATKISSVIFILIPLISFVIVLRKEIIHETIAHFLQYSVKFLSLTLIIFIIFSPYNFISFEKFIGTMLYESSVASGKISVFYTSQFDNTIPVLFQIINVFPYALGIPLFVISIAGFLFLSWKDKAINLLRFAFLIYFLPNAFLYAKWTRFMSPIFPIMIIFALLFLWKISNINNFLFHVVCYMLYVICLIPGLAYLSIYQLPDVRFQASDWIYKNIPNNSYILSETANVIDIPIPNPQNNEAIKQWNNYKIISFNFYDLDKNRGLQYDLQGHINKADYIFVPSRRIIKNYTCINQFRIQNSEFRIFSKFIQQINRKKCILLQTQYPLLNKYYEELFNGSLGFEKIAEFSSYPKLSLFGKTLIEFPDENAEETWTVFDHPVIRIYKRVQILSIPISIN